jgi:hypothetical protein
MIVVSSDPLLQVTKFTLSDFTKKITDNIFTVVILWFWRFQFNMGGFAWWVVFVNAD